MNKKILLLTTLTLVFALPVRAELTTSDTSSGDYLLNSGYSELTAEMVERSKGYANGQPYITPSERDLQERSGWERFWVKVYRYFDPAADTDQFMNHNIRQTPSINDL